MASIGRKIKFRLVVVLISQIIVFLLTSYILYIGEFSYNIALILIIFLIYSYLTIPLQVSKNEHMSVNKLSLLNFLLGLFQVLYLIILDRKDFYLLSILQVLALVLINEFCIYIASQDISDSTDISITLLLLLAFILLSFSVDRIRPLAYNFLYDLCIILAALMPVAYFIYNKNKIEKYGGHLKISILSLVLLNVAYIAFNVLLKHLSFTLLSYVFLIHINVVIAVINSHIYRKQIFLDCFFDLSFLLITSMIFKENLDIFLYSYIAFVFLRILKREIVLIAQIDDISFSHDSKLVNSIDEYEKEEIYKERISIFLHNEIIQDLLAIKRILKDEYSMEKDALIMDMLTGLINTTRDKINVSQPYINRQLSLKENYMSLFTSLRERYDKDILIDFICENDIFLSKPYDLLVYRILHELATNTYKHSKGNYSTISLSVVGLTIRIIKANYNDSIEKDKVKPSSSRGLQIIKREVDRFSGNYNLYEGENELITEIVMPIERELSYEYFINR